MTLRLFLVVVGALLFVASRLSRRVRCQITRDVVISVASKDGVARSYFFDNRRASSRSGRAISTRSRSRSTSSKASWPVETTPPSWR